MISLGSANMGLGLTVRLVDQFSGRSAVVSSQMSRMQKQAFAMQTASLTTARNYGVGMGLAGTIMTAGFVDMAKSAAKFDWLMTGTRAVTQASLADYRKMSRVAIELSKKYIFTAQEVASAMEYLGRAGFRVTDVNKTIEAVTQLGAATDTAIGGKGGAADMMTNMMTAFNKAAKDSTRMADILTYATTRSNIDINDLHESMKFLGQAATDLKIPFEDATAMITVLGNAGLRGGIAGRSLNNMLLYLAKSVGPFRTKRQTDVFAGLGMHPDMLRDVKGNFLPIIDILAIFQNKLSKLAAPDRVAVLQSLFNIRGARAFTPLIRATQLGLNFGKMLDELNRNSQGTAKRIADMRLNTLMGQSRVLHDIWEAFRIEVGKIIEPHLMTFIKRLQTIVKWSTNFVKTPYGKPIVKLAAAGALTLTIFGGITALMATMRLSSMAAGVAGVTAANSIAAAWGRATVAASAYNVAQNASWVGAGGQMARKGTKGFISSASGSAVGAAAGAASGGLLARFGRFLKGIVPFFRGIGQFLTRMPGWVKIAGLVILAFTDFSSVLKYVTYGLGHFGAALQWVGDFISDGLEVANRKFKARSYNIGVRTGFIDPTGGKKTAQQQRISEILERKKAEADLNMATRLLKETSKQEQQRRFFEKFMPGALSRQPGPYNPDADTLSANSLKGQTVAKEVLIRFEVGGQKWKDMVLEVLDDYNIVVKE